MQDEERRRLARELHDSAGQLLAAIAMNIAVVQSEAHKLSKETAARISDNAAMVDQLSTEIRTLLISCILPFWTRSVCLPRYAGI